jgi:hypothetical protein
MDTVHRLNSIFGRQVDITYALTVPCQPPPLSFLEPESLAKTNHAVCGHAAYSTLLQAGSPPNGERIEHIAKDWGGNIQGAWGLILKTDAG